MATKVKIKEPIRYVVPAKLTVEAHEVLPKLAEKYAEKFKLSNVSMIDAASKAIIEAYERFEKEPAQ